MSVVVLTGRQEGRTGHIGWSRSGEVVDISFLHGFSDSGACWDPIVRALGDRWGVLASDARGHGSSGLPEGTGGVDQQAGDAAMVLDALPPRPGGAIVAGHSMGAGTAIALAGLRPDLVAGLVLEDPVLRSPEENQPARDGGPLPDWLLALRALPLPERIARGRADNPGWPEDELTVWARSKEEIHADFSRRRSAAGQPALERLLALTCPVLLLRGDPERGSIVAPAAAEAAAAAGHVRVVHIAGVGHSIRREDRSRYLVELAAFLGEHAA